MMAATPHFKLHVADVNQLAHACFPKGRIMLISSFLAFMISVNAQTATEVLRSSDSTSLFKVLNNGNVGIGITNPQQLLVLRGNETASGEQFQINSIAGARTWGIGVNNSGGLTIRDETGLVNPISISAGSATGSISIGTNSISLLTGGVGSNIRFSTNASERMRIDHSGNLGIGIIAPSEKLDVDGIVRMTGFKLPTGATNNFVLTSDGTGVGTWQAAPGASTSGTANYISKFTNVNTLGNSGIFESGTGYVGIGTATPQQLLVLRGNETASGEQFQINSIAGSRTWGIGVGSSGGLTIRDETGLVNPISISAGAATGSLSIGTNSISLLTGGLGSNIKFSTNASERMRIDHNGFLGIGTATPTAKLEVNGQVKITGGSPGLDKVLTSDADGLATWQAPHFAYIYNLTSQTIAIGADIPFDSNGSMTSGFTHTAGSSIIQIVNSGTYVVHFSVSGTEPNQFALFLNGSVVPGGIYGSGSGIQQNSGRTIIPMTAGDNLSLRNYSSATAVGLASFIGGTEPNVNASILIEKL